MNKSLYTQTTNNPNSSSVVGSENFIAEETPSGKDISDSEKLADELGRSFHLTTLRELVQSSSSHTIAAVPSHEEDGTVGQLPIEKLFSKQHLSMQSVTSTGGHFATGDGDVEAGLGKIVVQDSTIKSIRKIRHAMSRLSFNGGSSRIAAVVDSNSMFCTSMQILPLSSSLDSEMEETAAKPTDSTVECQP